jgi:hypothetical protein
MNFEMQSCLIWCYLVADILITNVAKRTCLPLVGYNPESFRGILQKGGIESRSLGPPQRTRPFAHFIKLHPKVQVTYEISIIIKY